MGTPESIEAGLQRAQTVLYALPVAVAQCSAEMRFLWVSQRYADWLGLPRDQVIGRPISEVLGEECVAHMQLHVAEALAGRAMKREVVVHHKGLGPRWVHVDCVPTFGPGGVPDGWIEAISDVTERHTIEERLEENRTTLQSFYDSSPFLMGLVELDGESIVYLYTNQTVARSLGSTPEEMVYQAADLFSAPWEVALWGQHYQQSRREGAPVTFEYQQGPEQGNRWLRSTVAFVGEVRGRPRFSFVAEEITEHKKMLEALREANRSKDEFLAMLGHELRNPLSPIVTALDILRGSAHGRNARTLAIVRRQVQYLVRLVDDLLDVSRVTRGRLQIRRRPLRIQEVVAQGIEMATPLVEQRRHHLEVKVPADDLTISGDPGRLAQVVANLLTNSAKYTEPGGRITVEARREGSEIVLSVADTGIGIAPELLPHVFELFTQEQQAADRATGGLGIGLAIVRNLIELHGGSVTAESAGAGLGSRFTVRLPAIEEPAAIEPGSSITPPKAETSKRVLLVDDNEDALQLLGEVLRGAGYQVAMAKDGPAALDALARFPADVAILDIGLPVMDGYEVARRMRKRLGPAAPKMIALTGYGRDSDRERARSEGFAQHLTKPVDLASLLGAIAG
jgi:PAS domain S-box-containing protein